MEKMLIKGVAKDTNVARITIVGLPDEPGIAFKIFSRVAKAHVNVDIILQSPARDGVTDISFTVAESDASEAEAALRAAAGGIGCSHIAVDRSVAKVSIVGAGLMDAPGMAVRMFEALAECGINIQMIASSEIKLSAVIDRADADRAVTAIHGKYFG